MIYEITQSDTERDVGHVDAINYNNDGEIYLACFIGLKAEERTRAYASLKESAA